MRSAGNDGKFCTKDDVDYEVTPVNGSIEIQGLAAGKYSIVEIGSKNTIGDFTISDSTFTSAITTKYGTKCTSTSSKASLAATGMALSHLQIDLLVAALLLMVSGVALQHSRRKS